MIITSYFIVGGIFVFFSARLLKEIKRSFHKEYAEKNAKSVKVSLYFFSFSIIYRVVFNLAYIIAGDNMCHF